MRRAHQHAVLELLVLVGSFQPLCGWQQVGAHTTAGNNNARTSYNVDAELTLPLAFAEEVPLEGVSRAKTLLAFGELFLVGEAGPNISYHLFERRTGERIWTWSSGQEGTSLPYVPSYAQGRVLLGGTEGGVAAVRVADGEELWRDESVGSTSSRFPLLTGDIAIYHGENGVAAAIASTGEELWRLDISTAEAPLSLLGNRIYVIRNDLKLLAVNVLSGAIVWESESGLPGHCLCSVVAAEDRVFATSFETLFAGWVTSFDSISGSVNWQSAALPTSWPSAALLAQGRLITVGGNQQEGKFTAFQPDNGELKYERHERPHIFDIPVPFQSILHPLAGGSIFAYLNLDEAIQFRELASGELVWSVDIQNEPVLALSAAGSELYALLPDRVRVYRSSFERFVPHFASGQSQSTEILIANDSAQIVSGRLEFYDSQGTLIPVELEGLNQSDPPGFAVPSRSALRLSTAAGEVLQSGWIRLLADGPLAVSSLFRADGQAAGSSFEAGIADAKPLSQATIAVRLEGSLNTAVAIANPLGSAVDIQLTLKGAGSEAGSQIRLSGHQHLARFIDELFPDQTADGFEGALVLQSDRPIVVTALRTLNRLQLSSLPVGRQ